MVNNSGTSEDIGQRPGPLREIFGVGRVLERDLPGDGAGLDQLQQRVVERPVPGRAAGLHDVRDLESLAVLDQVAELEAADQHLVGEHDTPAVGPGEQPLREHDLQRLPEHRADLVLLAARVRVDDLVDGLVRGRRVHRADHQVAGLGRADREGDRLQVAQLPDHDHIRVLAQGGLERVCEGAGAGPELALVDRSLLDRMHILDRVLDRQHVVRPARVDQVDHGSQRRRLAAARLARNQDQPLVVLARLPDLVGEAELLEGRQGGAHHPEAQVDPLALEERV